MNAWRRVRLVIVGRIALTEQIRTQALADLAQARRSRAFLVERGVHQTAVDQRRQLPSQAAHRHVRLLRQLGERPRAARRFPMRAPQLRQHGDQHRIEFIVFHRECLLLF